MLFPLLAVLAWTSACAPSRVIEMGPSSGYRAAFPTMDMSGQLSSAFRAVKQLQVSVDYRVYSFAEDDAPSGLDLEREDVVARAAATTTVSETRRATAVIVSRSSRGILLLTAAHAVFRPDTIIEYFGPPTRVAVDPRRRIRSISIKDVQTNWVLGLPGTRPFAVLAWDAAEDVALIGFRHAGADDLSRAWPLEVPAGDPDDLVPGSFVYVLGYPGGYRMVSRGVATPKDDGRDGFVIDGNWNQGVSGGAVLAMRGTDEALEWVGMARAAAAVSEQRFVPAEVDAEQYDPAVPYEGPIFLEDMLRIQYGVTLSVSMTTIRAFIDGHRAELVRLGYDVPRL
ncbi:MAG: serine protease [Gemmatimonadota bacterium]